jgi:hypothetical protein
LRGLLSSVLKHQQHECYCSGHTPVALGDVVALEFLSPVTAAWFCTKDKYNLSMFSEVCQAETKAE